MKFTLLLFISAFSLTVSSQSDWKIELSRDLKEARMGVWEIRDYKIYVGFEQLETNFRRTAESSTNAISYYGDKDSNLVKYFNDNAKRYQTAADQLAHAHHGFDLRSIILYPGIEDKKQNVGNSRLVEGEVKQLVEKGNAIVYYKGKRIYTLTCKSEYYEEGGILNSGYEVRTYVDDVNNFVFHDYQHMGW
jgi:hypothetical protein